MLRKTFFQNLFHLETAVKHARGCVEIMGKACVTSWPARGLEGVWNCWMYDAVFVFGLTVHAQFKMCCSTHPGRQATSGSHCLVLEDHLETFLSNTATICVGNKVAPSCSVGTMKYMFETQVLHNVSSTYDTHGKKKLLPRNIY